MKQFIKDFRTDLMAYIATARHGLEDALLFLLCVPTATLLLIFLVISLPFWFIGKLSERTAQPG